MIPKIINYCWFGGNEPPSSFTKILESWKHFCPDYQIIRWDETNYYLNSNPYLRVAFNERNFAFVSDYARLDIIRKHGGIYLDVDVELIRSLDEIVEKGPFFAMEDVDQVNTGLAFGADKNNKTINELCRLYEKMDVAQSQRVLRESNTVEIITKYLHQKGFKFNGRTQLVNGFTIYRPSVFCPLQYGEIHPKIKADTVSIHHYNGSWVNTSDLSQEAQLRHARVARKMKKILGVTVFSWIKDIYSPLFGRKKKSQTS